MKDSSTMLEVRRIRDENSKRHLTMSNKEISQEMEKSVAWFLNVIGKPVPIISLDIKQTV